MQAIPDQLAAEFVIPGSDIRKALNDLAGVRAERMLPALIGVFLAQSTAAFVFTPAGDANILGWLAYGCAAGCSILWARLRHNSIESHQVQTILTLVGVSILVHTLVKLRLTSDSTQATVVIGALLVGSAFALSSWGHFVCLAALSLSGWIAVARPQMASPELIYWSLALIMAASGSALRARRRLQEQSRLVEASLTQQVQQNADRLRQQHLQLAAEATNGAIWYWDLLAEVFQCSAAWETMFGYELKELGTNVDAWFSRVHPAYLKALRENLAAHLEGGSAQFENEHRFLRKDGTYTWVLARGVAVRDQSGKVIALAGSHTDISSLIDVEKRLLNDSCLDKLTNLSNRHYFMSQLEKAIEQRNGDRRRAYRFAVMFLDLNRFKIVNDSLGHSAGDELLVGVAARLQNCARPYDVVARFGGDEFVILLNRLRDVDEALHVGNRIQAALSEPFQIGGREVLSGVSIGIAMSGEEANRSEDLLRFADIAMYQAKSKKDGTVRVFDATMNAQATKLCDLENDLRRALDRQEFVLHYQPTVSMRSGKILGVEALIRWQRSAQELVAPAAFIPMAEDLGLINDIGEWALRSACVQNVAWQRAGMPPVRMAVNISAHQLQQRGFSKQVRHILKETKLPAGSLELELTETALMDSFDRAPAALNELLDLGLGVAIDDFGTGYSSLKYLRQFNFHTLKMDRCFILDIALNKKAASVAKGLITLAHDLDLSVIAEGVEHDDQRQFLETHACDQLQGFLASRPLPAEQVTKLLEANDPLIGLPLLGGDLTRLASVHHPVNDRQIDLREPVVQ